MINSAASKNITTFCIFLLLAGCQSAQPQQQTPEVAAIQRPTANPTLTPRPTPTPPPVNVTVSVVDPGDTPIVGAAVRLTESGGAEGIVRITDDNGEVTFANLNRDAVSISAQGAGYLPGRTFQTVLPGENDIQITLEPDPDREPAADDCQPEKVYSSARHMKVPLYNRLEYSPDVVILGSSRAYTISPAYIEQNTGAKGFNMTIQGGSFLDIYVYTQYILARQQDSPLGLLLVEFQVQTINQDTLTGVTPIDLWPYIPDNESFKPDLDFCDIIFNPEQNEKYRGVLVWIFEPDGLAVHRPITTSQYRIALERQVQNLKDASQCDSLPPISIEYVEKLVTLSLENKISIVFFRPPFNEGLYDTFKNEPAYINCSNLTNALMQGLANSYENIFFQDLSDYEQISDMTINGYYDGQHLRPAMANLIVDSLLPSIHAGLEWSRQQR